MQLKKWWSIKLLQYNQISSIYSPGSRQNVALLDMAVGQRVSYSLPPWQSYLSKIAKFLALDAIFLVVFLNCYRVLHTIRLYD
jgi:hypothetical protein